MSKIVEASVHVLRVPLRELFRTSNKTVDSSSLIVCRLRSDDGHLGWGEGALNRTFTDETPASARESLQCVTQGQVLGHGVEQAFAALPDMHLMLGGQVAVRCALSTALWDLRARALGVPLHVLLGATRRSVVRTTYHLGSFDLDQDAQAAARAVEAGFSILKLKIGRPDVLEDLAAVQRVREAVGPDPRIYVDVNQAWTLSQAWAFVARAHDLGVQLVEQPLPMRDVQGAAELSRGSGVAVAADEGVHNAEQLLGLMRAGAAPAAVVIKLLKAGGIDGVLDLLGLCRLGGILPFLAGMPGDTSIASAAMLHIALVAPDLPLGTAITPHFSREDVASPVLSVEGGQLHGEDLRGPGLGVNVDLQRLRSLEVG